MPTYEYACAACGHAFEEFHSITAKPVTRCPKCRKNKVQRLISAGAGVIFKGSGFYQTDYRSEAYKSAAKADSGPAATTDTKTDSKSETKSASPKTESQAAPKSETKAPAKPAAPAPKGKGHAAA